MRGIAVPVAVAVGLLLGTPDAAGEDPGLAVDPTGPLADLLESIEPSRHELRFAVAAPALSVVSVGVGYSFAPTDELRVVADLSAGLNGAQLTLGLRRTFGSAKSAFLVGADLGIWRRWILPIWAPPAYPKFSPILRLQALGWEARLSRHTGMLFEVGAVVNLRGSEKYENTTDCGGDTSCDSTVSFPALVPEIRLGFVFLI
jgi:hypothetical protein